MAINPIELQKALRGAEYPADRAALVRLARDDDAPDEVVREIEQAAPDRFEGPQDVEKAVFGRD